MARRRLIFFVSADPRKDASPAWSAYHFAEVAAGAGLEAEVRLAGDAVRVAQLDVIDPTDEKGRELKEKAAKGAGAPFLVSL